ncbi:GATA zinc finger domain-containing protein 14-like [Tachysurus fulvidraco]|uniref:GATA zinc finger domain-containing protein 14-like n=1 Tax=Tachysurus fulvidraco TaxID=1234273 RepID=UPI001FEDF209|nr:GATA zinc finger domain-containing protein 14-like [Tachysurus fulvidraco]
MKEHVPVSVPFPVMDSQHNNSCNNCKHNNSCDNNRHNNSCNNRHNNSCNNNRHNSCNSWHNQSCNNSSRHNNSCDNNRHNNSCNNRHNNSCNNNRHNNSCDNNRHNNSCNSWHNNSCNNSRHNNSCNNNRHNNSCNSWHNQSCNSRHINNCNRNPHINNCNNSKYNNSCNISQYNNSWNNSRHNNSCNNNRHNNSCNSRHNQSCNNSRHITNCNRNPHINNCINSQYNNSCNISQYNNSCNNNRHNSCNSQHNNSCNNSRHNNSCNNNRHNNSCDNNRHNNNCNSWHNQSCNNSRHINNCNRNPHINNCNNSKYYNSCNSWHNNSCNNSRHNNSCNISQYNNSCHNSRHNNPCNISQYNNSCNNSRHNNPCNISQYNNSCNNSGHNNPCNISQYNNSCNNRHSNDHHIYTSHNYTPHNYTPHNYNYHIYISHNYTPHNYNHHNYTPHNHHNYNLHSWHYNPSPKPGSVIADFSITSTTNNIDLASANQQLATNLINSGFSVSGDLLSQSVQGELTNINRNIYPGSDLKLTCNPPLTNGINWTLNGIQLQQSDKYVINNAELTVKNAGPTDSGGCITCNYTINKQDCQNGVQTKQFKCQLTQPISDSSYNSETIEIQVKNQGFDCSDKVFGAGNQGAIQTANCDENMAGYKKAQCISKKWTIIEDNCVLIEIQNLKNEAENLQVSAIPQFMASLSSNATSQSQNLFASAATITTIVDILTIVSGLSQTTVVSQTIMTDFIKTAEVIGTNDTSGTWEQLNKNNETSNTSNLLLNATENIARRLPDEDIIITTNFTSVKKKTFTAPFSEAFGKNSTQINIPVSDVKTSLTVIISSAFNNILPVRTLTNNNSSQTGTKINGDVAVIETNSTINNISLSFDVINITLGKPQCVFWNFNILNGLGGWDSTGCQLKLLGNETERYTCECNHTTSFSILMSPFTLDKDQDIILDYITYIGVGISMGSLVLCLIIEIIIWKSVTRNDTSFMRHVAIVNIAVSLLIANICFIIGAAVANLEGPCSTATFFMHFFYLALFFWMLLSALLLLYRTLMVFSRMTRGAMMAIGFTVGYGAPLIIAVITVASTAGGKGYIQQGYNCWLNWNKTKALLAFVIPALTIVAINLLVLIAVLFKMLRRGVNASVQPDEKHPLVIIAKCVAILTPLFGLTWGFGIGTLVSQNFGIHVVFAFLNSLQGFFILIFGIILDSKVREALAGKFSLRNLSSGRTRSTSAGPTSSSGLPFMQRLRQRNVYNVQANSGTTASTSNNSYAPINT